MASATASPEFKKNAYRLSRIFRKPKSMVVPRSWHTESPNGDMYGGVSLSWLRRMIDDLSDEERTKAAAHQDPLSLVQEELSRRAARFGLSVTAAAAAAAAGGNEEAPPVPLPIAVDEETLRARVSRFTTPEQAAMDEAMERRAARFGAPAPAPAAAVELKLSDADREAMLRRQQRFAS